MSLEGKPLCLTLTSVTGYSNPGYIYTAIIQKSSRDSLKIRKVILLIGCIVMPVRN